MEGTDEQWQGAVFDLYDRQLSKAGVWPTIGNHEMGAGQVDMCLFRRIPQCDNGPIPVPLGGTSTSADPASYDGDGDMAPDGGGVPYLDIFSLPVNAEAGGVASGTEQYYSFDHGNVHVVSLDSQLSARDARQLEIMRQWLISDLQANTRDWTIVIFHHPPYSKGTNHDSDMAEHSPIDKPQYDMRTRFTPLFESHGVDLVFSGHSHSYERSFYLQGHTGLSSSYSHAEHAELLAGDASTPALGNQTQLYQQMSPTSGGIDDRVVYTVAGSSGKANHDSGLMESTAWLMHPAHIVQPQDPEGRHGLAVKGSVVVDAGSDTLTTRFVDIHGQVLDWFTITR